MANQKGVLERYLDAMEKTGDIMLRYVFQKEMERIHIRVEADAILQLRDMLDSLGQ